MKLFFIQSVSNETKILNDRTLYTHFVVHGWWFLYFHEYFILIKLWTTIQNSLVSSFKGKRDDDDDTKKSIQGLWIQATHQENILLRFLLLYCYYLSISLRQLFGFMLYNKGRRKKSTTNKTRYDEDKIWTCFSF